MPASIDALREAMGHHLRSDFQSAHDQYAEILRNDPSNHHAWHLLGVLLIHHGYVETGEAYIAKAIELCGSYPEAEENLAVFENSMNAKVKREIEAVPEAFSRFRGDDGSVGACQIRRSFDFVGCLLDPNDTWLTIADSQGHDANWLRQLGVAHTTSSSLDVSLLQRANALGDIDAYLQINAERIPLDDNAFDYVLCKQGLHHMPRPYQAIYEMVRVARKGIVFIEPQDQLIDWPARKETHFYRELADDPRLGKKVVYKRIDDDQMIAPLSVFIDWYEDGPNNYVYTMSLREIRKVALGMGLPSYATKCFNEYFKAELMDYPAEDGNEAYEKWKEQIAAHDLACENIGKPYSHITGILFKQTPMPGVIRHLANAGYDFTITPSRFLPIRWPKLEE